MRLQNLLEIVGGELHTSPEVSLFTDVVAQAESVKRGSLYLADSVDSAKRALELGAYGIVTLGNMPVLDEEVAWVVVDSLDNAMVRLLRYDLLHTSHRFYLADGVTDELIEAICADPACIVLKPTLTELFGQLHGSSAETHYCISSDSLLLSQLVSAYETITPAQHLPFRVEKHTLFTMSLRYEETSYEALRCSPLFQLDLAKAVYFLESHHLAFDLVRLRQIPHFSPHFLGKNGREISFGSSSRVLLWEPDLRLVLREMTYLEQHARWAERLYLLPAALREWPLISHDVIFWETEQEIWDAVMRKPFHFLLVAGASERILGQLSREKEPPHPLF